MTARQTDTDKHRHKCHHSAHSQFKVAKSHQHIIWSVEYISGMRRLKFAFLATEIMSQNSKRRRLTFTAITASRSAVLHSSSPPLNFSFLSALSYSLPPVLNFSSPPALNFNSSSALSCSSLSAINFSCPPHSFQSTHS